MKYNLIHTERLESFNLYAALKGWLCQIDLYFISLYLFRAPTVTGTSVLGLCFDGGVIIAADMLGSYGALARYRNLSRVMKVNDSAAIGISGDYADYQFMKSVIEQRV